MVNATGTTVAKTTLLANEISNIEDLTYKTVTDAKGVEVSGYDISNKKGAIKIFDDRSITANPKKVEEWNIKVTFVNYDEDQSLNMVLEALLNHIR